jgi:adenylate cyclase
MEAKNPQDGRSPWVTGILVALLLAALPLAVWLDLKNLADAALRRQASDLNSVISSVRAYYASNVVGRVLAHPGETRVVHNYESVPGAIPIPATLSLELGRVISEQQEHRLSLCIGLSVQEPLAAHARRVREGLAAEPARQSRPETR